ncbi:uncharacterized protein LOC135399494 [Ornithodoros turicata]|uniref:uncharacterized protein LOC135399494 n=1 Tax=Ornithodoros turicata TaxID=34597 RepID=UPI003139043D
MPKRGTGHLCRFLVTHLDRQTFGEKLVWLDKAQGVFSIYWAHGNNHSSDPEKDHEVFTAWDKLKKRKPVKGACNLVKQRFRIAINKMNIRKLREWNGEEPQRDYQIRQIPQEDMNLVKKLSRRVQRREPPVEDMGFYEENEEHESSGDGDDLSGTEDCDSFGEVLWKSLLGKEACYEAGSQSERQCESATVEEGSEEFEQEVDERHRFGSNKGDVAMKSVDMSHVDFGGMDDGHVRFIFDEVPDGDSGTTMHLGDLNMLLVETCFDLQDDFLAPKSSENSVWDAAALENYVSRL